MDLPTEKYFSTTKNFFFLLFLKIFSREIEKEIFQNKNNLTIKMITKIKEKQMFFLFEFCKKSQYSYSTEETRGA